MAEEVERREQQEFGKVGANYWCHLGGGIGSEPVGKGEKFTRPVLVLAQMDERLIFIVPITTKTKRGRHYVEIMVNGVLENAILYQGMLVDVKRIGDFIDEVPPIILDEVRQRYLNFIRRLLHKEY